MKSKTEHIQPEAGEKGNGILAKPSSEGKDEEKAAEKRTIEAGKKAVSGAGLHDGAEKNDR